MSSFDTYRVCRIPAFKWLTGRRAIGCIDTIYAGMFMQFLDHLLQRIVSLGLCFLGWRLSEIAQHLETIFFQDLNVSFVALNSACNLLYNPVYIYCECTVVLASYQTYLDTCLRAPIDCEILSFHQTSLSVLHGHSRRWLFYEVQPKSQMHAVTCCRIAWCILLHQHEGLWETLEPFDICQKWVVCSFDRLCLYSRWPGHLIL